MAKITWLGEDDYREGETPLSSCTWKDILFTAGDKVEISDEWMIKKARGNRFFRVEEDAAPLGPAKPEMWTNDPVQGKPRRRGRPPRIRDNGDGNNL